MNSMPVTEADLHAYVDGLLPPARRTEIEQYLATHPAEAERIRIYPNSRKTSGFSPRI